MKIHLSFPSHHQLRQHFENAQKVTFSYTELKATLRSEKIKGYDNDHNFIKIGEGEKVWAKAKKLLQEWKQFPPLWTKISPAHTPLQEGLTVNVLFRLFGFWWVNAARIVYTLDSETQFGFAYGTLEQHVETGEECFWIERNTKGEVFYHIKAFSKPKFWMVKLAYPLARYYQRRFVRESMNQMQQKCHE